MLSACCLSLSDVALCVALTHGRIVLLHFGGGVRSPLRSLSRQPCHTTVPGTLKSGPVFVRKLLTYAGRRLPHSESPLLVVPELSIVDPRSVSVSCAFFPSGSGRAQRIASPRGEVLPLLHPFLSSGPTSFPFARRCVCRLSCVLSIAAPGLFHAALGQLLRQPGAEAYGGGRWR